ncbi:hypothetical protein PFISCL1PPCAC_1528, partial [Pristionchus fissidentatus]
PSDKDEITSELSSFRFDVICHPGKNLYSIFGEMSNVHGRTSKGAKLKKFHDSSLFDMFYEKYRCDPHEIIDYCTDPDGQNCLAMNLTEKYECAKKLWHHNATSETWQRVDELQCDKGYWVTKRKETKSVVLSGSIFCGEQRPQCAFKEGHKVTMILLCLYCVVASIVLIVLFVVLFKKMDSNKGESKFKIVRTKGTRDRKASSSGGSGSGSSSTNELKVDESQKGGARKRLSSKKSKGKENRKKNSVSMLSTRIEETKKARQKKTNADDKLNSSGKSGKSGNSGETDVDRLHTFRE